MDTQTTTSSQYTFVHSKEFNPNISLQILASKKYFHYKIQKSLKLWNSLYLGLIFSNSV